ncbi:hypothetical protein DEJ49_33685 [Streptomyces venezuelae]|uniref:Uncharacterized protein n=1 Tax=Streptomyces venezuelae TaxID=54571 RepID=A0A5P2CQV9_STRVZ|nr:hypothetical protein DEJ49_33685 [Streptomyces venezuelae]
MLDAEITAMTLQRLTDPEQLATIRRVQERHRALREPYEEEILRRGKIRAYFDQRLAKEVITLREHAASVADLDSAIVSAREALRRLDTIPVPDLDDKTCGLIVTGWSTASASERYRDLRRAWKGFQLFVRPGSSTDSAEQVRARISRPKPIPPAPHR